MPKTMERELKREARKKGFSKERTGAYVYGTMRKTGWKPSTQKHTFKKGSPNKAVGNHCLRSVGALT